jgi:hypothetical protein
VAGGDASRFPPAVTGTGDRDLDGLERRLVWMMGSPRTGSTWLLRLLLHPWGVGRTPTGIDPSRFRPRGGNVIPVNESYLLHHLGPMRDPLPPPGSESSVVLNDLRRTDPAYFFSDVRPRLAWATAGAGVTALRRASAPGRGGTPRR